MSGFKMPVEVKVARDIPMCCLEESLAALAGIIGEMNSGDDEWELIIRPSDTGNHKSCPGHCFISTWIAGKFVLKCINCPLIKE